MCKCVICGRKIPAGELVVKPVFAFSEISGRATEPRHEAGSAVCNQHPIVLDADLGEVRHIWIGTASGPAPVVTEEDVISTMADFGGGFVSALAAAWRKADLENRRRLRGAFGELWDELRAAVVWIRENAAPEPGEAPPAAAEEAACPSQAGPVECAAT